MPAQTTVFRYWMVGAVSLLSCL